MPLPLNITSSKFYYVRSMVVAKAKQSEGPIKSYFYGTFSSLRRGQIRAPAGEGSSASMGMHVTEIFSL